MSTTLDQKDEFRLALKRFKNPKNPFKYGCQKYSFQQSMALPLTILQLFWVFPINKISGKSSERLKVKLISWKMLFAVFSASLQVNHLVRLCTELIFVIPDMAVKIGLLTRAIEGVVQIFIFLYLAYSWKNVVRQWELVDKSMRFYESPLMNAKRIFRNIMIIILVILIVDFPAIIATSRRYYFPDRKYSYSGFLLKWAEYIALPQRLFIWLFRDVLIIIISICFMLRLQQIQHRLSFLIRMRVDNFEIWRSTREGYAKLMSLCQIMNHTFSWLIITSYACNIEFILVTGFSRFAYSTCCPAAQLFRLSFVVVRVILVSYFGGSLNSENEKIVDLLVSVPSDIYNKEVERFLYHASSKEMMFTGKKFFNITRSLILKVANAVVVYELVIMQFVQNFREIK